MAITGIGYGRTFVYEAQKRVNAGDVQSAQGSATETAESRFAESIEELAKEDNTVKTPVTRGVQLARHIEGKDKVPYGEMAEDGVIEYNGVTFVCDYEHNRLTLGDTTNKEDCINIPLSGGGSLLVNRDNIDALSKAIGMFSPEDVNWMTWRTAMMWITVRKHRRPPTRTRQRERIRPGRPESREKRI